MEWGQGGGEECGGTLESLMGAREAPTGALEWSTDAREGCTGPREGSVDALEFFTGAREGVTRPLERRPGTLEWVPVTRGGLTDEREACTRDAGNPMRAMDGSGQGNGLARDMRVPVIVGVGEDLDESHGATIR